MLRRCVRSWRRACEARIIRIRERFACGHSAASSGSGATDESIRLPSAQVRGFFLLIFLVDTI